ncbi:aldose epimerase [Thermostichus vulcanus]|uniref:aldose epimerase family protein n=1 Tax=Thermostichus vulcanus TaxID=32053 RepID=UPI001FCC7131|nr:aldose epimerase [Thermostichus vulcanus]
MSANIQLPAKRLRFPDNERDPALEAAFVYSITSFPKPYLTYLLKDEHSGSEAEIVPERGGMLTRWRIQGEEILYMDEERFLDPSLTVRGGIPILFPICGNLPDNTYSHGGRSYTLKQHGFARNLPWQVVDQDSGAEAGQASLTLMLESDAQTLAAYPFEFTLLFSYQLRGRQLLLKQHITNCSAENMPFSVGFHPYFNVSEAAKPQLQIQIPAQELYDHLSQTSAPFTGTFDWTAPEIDVAFKTLTAQEATVVDPVAGRKVTLTYDECFRTLVFWTVRGKPFFCLEPWTGPRNALISGEQRIQLPPGDSLETQFVLQVDALN